MARKGKKMITLEGSCTALEVHHGTTSSKNTKNYRNIVESLAQTYPDQELPYSNAFVLIGSSGLLCVAMTISNMAGDEKYPWPRAQEAREYLAKHRVIELFDNMTSQLIYERPGRQTIMYNGILFQCEFFDRMHHQFIHSVEEHISVERG